MAQPRTWLLRRTRGRHEPSRDDERKGEREERARVAEDQAEARPEDDAGHDDEENARKMEQLADREREDECRRRETSEREELALDALRIDALPAREEGEVAWTRTTVAAPRRERSFFRLSLASAASVTGSFASVTLLS
jgi:hypothetical protein